MNNGGISRLIHYNCFLVFVDFNDLLAAERINQLEQKSLDAIRRLGLTRLLDVAEQHLDAHEDAAKFGQNWENINGALLKSRSTIKTFILHVFHRFRQLVQLLLAEHIGSLQHCHNMLAFGQIGHLQRVRERWVQFHLAQQLSASISLRNKIMENPPKQNTYILLLVAKINSLCSNGGGLLNSTANVCINRFEYFGPSEP